ncbi:CTLH/CRA C-terminal to lish motif domain-containing protein [Xylariomycetidae sp. FL0641]|nr:CTLH/CRA C-terminal to lish motif domain-containing protein [Xylariomycetidae sp. FL0641]
MSMLKLQGELPKLTQSAKLADTLGDVDKIIDLLTSAKESVAAANDPHTTSLSLTKLQNPIKERLDGLSGGLKHVHKAQNDFNKSLRAAFTPKEGSMPALPTQHDPMESQTALINRAIAMHLLREGQFNVASTFISEAQPHHDAPPVTSPSSLQSPSSVLMDTPEPRSPTPTGPMVTDADDLKSLQSQALQDRFADMYKILTALKSHDLLPAINWARDNCEKLEARGSHLEFELCKLQFIWLFKGPSVNGLPDTPENGVSGALQYGRENFGRFQVRHLREIQKLSCAMVYSPNLADSPYGSIFDISLAFEEVSSSFTREFCSLLGLSAESPLYVAATAGALALPWVIKFTSKLKGKGAEWTTRDELPFVTPLPRSMAYHSIFVCPVSKEQTTDLNPPVVLPCGHVLARDTLRQLAKGSRYKCPYCPSEGVTKDARHIIL